MLQLSFNICQKSDCSIIEFTETTGIYNVTTNPTGWGTPNASIGSYAYSKLEFFDSTNTLVKTFELYPDFPTTNTLFSKELVYDIPDGLYRIVYTVRETKTTGTSYSTTIQQGFYCNVKCCVLSMIKDIDIDCGCSDHKLDNYNKAYALLQGLIYAACCGNITQFNNILGVLQKICLNKNCKNCKCK